MASRTDNESGKADKDYWRRENYRRAWALRRQETRQLANGVTIVIAVVVGIVFAVGLVDLIR
jgi:preprotein translocase subunit SecE